MNEQRATSVLASLPMNAQKIYAHVPVDEPAAVSKIHRACIDAGINSSHPVTFGCLKALADSGLIKAVSRDRYVRKVNIAGTATLAALEGGAEQPKLGEIMRPLLATNPAKPIPAERESPTRGSLSTKHAAFKEGQAKLDPLGLLTPGPLTVLGDIASRLGSYSLQLGNTARELTTLASQLEDVALTIESEREASKDSLDKLKQLQQLLKSIGD